MKNSIQVGTKKISNTKSGTNKYHAKKEIVDGIRFDSRKEASRYRQLKLMEKAKAIQDLQVHVKYPLFKKNEYGSEVRYIADFVYYENGHLVVEDVKGFKTGVYKLKKRILAEQRGIVIRET